MTSNEDARRRKKYTIIAATNLILYNLRSLQLTRSPTNGHFWHFPEFLVIFTVITSRRTLTYENMIFYPHPMDHDQFYVFVRYSSEIPLVFREI